MIFVCNLVLKKVMTYKFVGSTAGTIINTTVNIFRSDLRGYLSLALFSLLWSLIPIYGWAKSVTLLAAISTKAYQQLMGVSESDKEICARLNRKKWSFWALSILGGIYVFMAYIICAVIIIIVSYLIFGLSLQESAFFNTIVFGFLLFLLYLIIILGVSSLFFWLYGRVSFAELSLANENRSAFGSIGRAWYLSRGEGRKIQLVFTIGTAILAILWIGVPSLILSIISVLFGGFWLFYALVIAIFSSLFQISKGVIYYYLVCQRDGIDLNITTT